MARLYLYVSPGANRNDLEQDSEGRYRASVTARATDGKANRALLELLATRLLVPKSRIAIVRGVAARHKVVEIAGLDDDELLARLQRVKE